VTPLAARQVAAVVVVVLVLALAGGGSYPLWVDLMVYAVAALFTAVAVRQFTEWQTRRREAPDPRDRAHVQTREEALTEATDWVITSCHSLNPADTLTPDMVQAEALMRSGLEVEWDEAAEALLTRLRFRGYIA
jgi:hypothetical protein